MRLAEYCAADDYYYNDNIETMRALFCLIAAVLCVGASRADASPFAYGEAFDALYRIDLGTQTATDIGDNGSIGRDAVNDVTGLSLSSGGTLYAVSDTLKLLVQLNKNTGEASPVGSLGLAGQGVGQYDALDFGMTFGCDDNVLWLSSATIGKLWKVNPSSGTTTLVGSTGHTITGLAVHNGVLYGAGSRNDNFLYKINQSTGAVQSIGSYGSAQDHWINSIALNFDDGGTLWAVVNYIPPEPGTSDYPDWSDLAMIDPQTGEMTIVGPITGNSALRGIGLRGFTSAPTSCSAAPPTPPPVNPPSGSATAGVPLDARWAQLLLISLLAASAAVFRRRKRSH